MITNIDECGPALTDGDIDSLERAIGVALPTEYRDFLLQHNGGRPAPNGFPISNSNNPFGVIQVFFGIHDPIESCNVLWNWEVTRGRMPLNLLPIACDDGGDLICLSLFGEDAGAVLFWDCYGEQPEPSYSNVYRVAGSFVELLESVREIRLENEIERTIRTGTLDEMKALVDRARQEAEFPEELDTLAAMHGRTEALEYLIHAGFRSRRLVQVAAQNGHAETLRMLARLGFDVNVQDETGKTPLMFAAAFRHAETVETLLSLGARADISDRYGNTALGMALQGGDKETVAMISECPGSGETKQIP